MSKGMMREIEFRGRDKHYDGYGKWMYGSLDTSDLSPAIIENAAPIPCCAETVGQFTGLRDNHFQRIYEGDVLKFSWDSCCGCVEFFGVVRFIERKAAFCYWDETLKTWNSFQLHSEDMEVAGNIFDNPEFEERFGEAYRSQQ